MPTKSEVVAALLEAASSRPHGNKYSSSYYQNAFNGAFKEAKNRHLIPEDFPGKHGRKATNIPQEYLLATISVMQEMAGEEITGANMATYNIDSLTLNQLIEWLETGEKHW